MQASSTENIPSFIRAFFAIELSAQHKEAITHVISQLKRAYQNNPIHWTNPENLHITLQFLATISLQDLSHLIEQVQTEIKNIPSFAIDIGPLELFPTPNQPKIISLAIQSTPLLIQLVKAIEQGINRAGYNISQRPFRGHITLGRFHRMTTELLPTITLPAIQPIMLQEIVLFRSKSKSNGSIYTPLSRLALYHNV